MSGPLDSSKSYTLVSKTWGTSDYLAPDYLRDRQLNYAVDTFAYGMVMFQLVTGANPGTK